MLDNYKLSKTAVAVSLFCSSLALTGCGSDSKSTPTNPNPNPDPVPQASIFEAVQGGWDKVGYGEFVRINQDSLDMYEYNAFGCIKTGSMSYEQAEPLVEALEKTGDNELSLLEKGAVIAEFYQAADNLPDTCNEPLTVDENIGPQVTFDYFWHTFNDYYAFFELRQIDWQQAYDDYRPQVNDDTSDEELAEIFTAMLTPLKDAHVGLTAGDEGFSEGKPVPVEKAIIGAVVSSYRSGNPVTVEQFVEVFKQVYLSHQKGYVTEQSLGQFPTDSNFPTLLWGKTADNVGLLVINNMVNFSDDSTDAEGESTVQIVAAVKEKMDTVMAQLGQTEGLILDIRNNGGGTDAVSLAIVEYFADKDLVAFNKQSVNKAGSGHQYSATISANDAAYSKPVFLLTSQFTASAAEIFTLAMKQLDHVTLVGEETSGALSDVLALELPNGWSIALSNEVYQDPQGQGYEMSGFAPDHLVPAYTLESMGSEKFESYEFVLEKLGKWQKPQLSSEQFEQQLTDMMTLGKVPGVAVAVVKSGEIIYEKGFGKADETNRAVTSQTPFFLASVSKTVLGTTIAQAEADGKVSLDDAVEPLLGFDLSYPDEPDFAPSFRHLVTHTSGIIDEARSFNCSYYLTADNSSLMNLVDDELACEDNMDIDMGNFLASYLDQDGERFQAGNFTSVYGFEPGQLSFYSNIATGLAGHALEQKVGKTLSELSNQYVFAPLGMENTSWSIDGIPAGVASRYYYDEDSGNALPIPEYSAITYPDGGTISSARDMAKFISAAMNGGKYQGEQVLAASAVEQMLTNQTDAAVVERGIGYYWRLDGDYFSHNGGDPGVATEIWADTKKDIAVVLLSNGDSIDDEVGFDDMLSLLKTFARSQ